MGAVAGVASSPVFLLAQGFHRYSTDRQWHVPHFEKMLYDQAQLTVAYSQAFQVTPDPSPERRPSLSTYAWLPLPVPSW